MNGKTVRIPGHFRDNWAFLDLETEKVPCRYRMANDEWLNRRWSVVMAGVARNGSAWIGWRDDGDESEFLRRIGERVGNGPIVYAATREFDEMILRGQFTNARRAHAPEPFFPAMPGAAGIGWVNVYRDKVALHSADSPLLTRGADTPSKGVSQEIRAGGARFRTALIHNLRDVVELIVIAGQPDDECLIWCREVLSTFDFAYEWVYGW